MIDFKEEINKYKPALEIKDVENAIMTDEIKDVMDLLQQITEGFNGGKAYNKE